MTKRAVGFIHIPKTGGRSFNSALRRSLGERVRLVSVFDFANFGDDLQEERVVTGHIPFFIYDSENSRRQLFTILRDPQERVISNYNYILATPGHYAHDYVKRHRLSIAQCLDHPVLRIEFCDFQTKMLGWSPRQKMTWPAHGHEKLGTFFSEYNDFSYDQADDEMLAEARERLLRTITFGMSDDHRSLVALFHAITGNDLEELGRENRTPLTNYEVTNADLDAIRQSNLFDCDLVDFARGLLPKEPEAKLSRPPVVATAVLQDKPENLNDPDEGVRSAGPIHFAVICMGRTGSTLLQDLLSSHPDIEAAGELFNPSDGEFLKHPGLTERQFLEQHAYKTDRPIRGFKMPMDWIFDHPTIFADLAALNYQIIRLSRQDVLAQLLSVKLASRNGSWNSTQPYDHQYTEISPTEFAVFYGERIISEMLLDAFCKPFRSHQIFFEQLFDEGVQRKILSFLGAARAPLTTKTRPGRYVKIEHSVTNYEELAAFFKRTVYEGHFKHIPHPSPISAGTRA